ncbi:hypothetical protein PSEUDO9AZ_10720 [Pseudomonas sp. 9AZ]|uniref:2OG-Fe(II) oxygenase n=1 Tax=Pseudomonas sp. 9AZ TaxID=2653168 RepID=UPI0012EF22E5|nr:2OG-Fe(II) oxygenase [Pseudomonas sp. 9AZ]VXC39728.1 hypothetical protein PSEUDO9AZ_10720 [Pseudomonas sp. 9AZ]
MKIVTNPRAIIWPGQRLQFAIAESEKKVTGVMGFSSEILSFLRNSMVPTSIGELCETLDQVSAPSRLDDLIDACLLIPSSRNELLKYWKGFRISDCISTFKPYGNLEPVVTEKSVSNLPLYVVDNLFDSECIESLAAWFSTQAFSLSDVDCEQTAFSKHWVRTLESESAILKSVPTISWIDATCCSLLPSVKLKLVEAKAYMTPYGDTPTYHRDSEIGPTITALLFSHRKWEPDWGGELIICNESGEPHTAIFPKPGRLVVFRGDLPHKAGSPSRLAFDTRQTLVLRYELQ